MKGRASRFFASCVFLMSACGCSEVSRINPGGPAPGDPAPPAGPVSPVGSRVVRGVVFEYLPVFPDVRPAPGVPVRVFGGGRVVEAISRADGSFEADIPETAPSVTVVAAGPSYFTPCPAFRVAEDALFEKRLEVMVLSGAVLSNTRFWGGLPGEGGLVYGGVSEQTSAGRQGISGVGVTLTLLGSSPLEYPLAATLTDATGFYYMCLPTRSTDYVVHVRKEGYVPASGQPAYWSALGWDYEETNFVLTRR